MKPARIFLKFRIVACVFVSLISVGNALSQSLLNYVDTRVGSAYAETKTAGKFGKGSEEHGQTVPAAGVPHGMNMWTPQTRDTEKKCVAPYYYADEGMQAEVMGLSRAGMFRFTYDKAGVGYIVVYPNSDEGEATVEYDPAKREIRASTRWHRLRHIIT